MMAEAERLTALEATLAMLTKQIDREQDRSDRAIAAICADHASRIHRVRVEMAKTIDDFLTSHVRNHEHAHQAEQHAADLALRNMDQRLAAMNEFRAQIQDSELKYATKVELAGIENKLDLTINAMSDRLRAAEVAVIDIRGKLLGTEFTQSVDARFRFLERMVYMASGAFSIIIILLQFLKK